MNIAYVSAALFHGYQRASEVIVAGDITSGQVLLIVLIDVQGRIPARDCLLDPVAIAVIREARYHPADIHGDRSIFRVPGDATVRAGDHVAIIVVGVVTRPCN